jgi:stage III sporulation protein AB
MWLKILGSILIIITSTYIGFSLASRYAERPRQIRQLISCLSALKSHITYAAVPLPEALSQCTCGLTGPVADFFHTTSLLLLHNAWLTPQAAIAQVLKDSKQLVFNQPEWELLTSFSATLGSMDRTEQQKSLELIHDQLSRIQQDAETRCEQNVKMYRYLGVCSGLAIVIILV